MGSVRLPAKMLLPLGGFPVLELVVRRLQRASELDALCLATTTSGGDDQLVQLCASLGVLVFRGSDDDVLERFVGAAELAGADVIVRVCADNPLIAPEEVDRVVTAFNGSGADYAFNHIPAMDNGYPDGLGAEVFGRAILETVATNARTPSHREHVTSYVWDHPEYFEILTVAAPPEIVGPDVKLDLDTERDYSRLLALFAHSEVDAVRWSGAEIVRAYRSTIGAPS